MAAPVRNVLHIPVALLAFAAIPFIWAGAFLILLAGLMFAGACTIPLWAAVLPILFARLLVFLLAAPVSLIARGDLSLAAGACLGFLRGVPSWILERPALTAYMDRDLDAPLEIAEAWTQRLIAAAFGRSAAGTFQ